MIAEIIKRIVKAFSSKEDQKETQKIIEIKDNNVKLSFFKNLKLIDVKVQNNNYYMNIDLNKATPEQIIELKNSYTELKEKEFLFLEEKDYSHLKTYIKEDKDTPVLKYFKCKIEEMDYKALRTSVFIKKRKDAGEDITEYLKQLSNDLGTRGMNICNLYHEGYFDSFIKPYYIVLESENRIEDFKKGFDDFVTQLPITYFANRYKSQEQINKDLDEKIEKSKKYGIKRLNIHGINKDNKKKIVNFIEGLKDKPELVILSRNETSNHISITIEINHEVIAPSQQ